MKNKNFIFCIFLSLATLTCSNPEKEADSKDNVYQITEFELYNKELAYDVIFDSEEIETDSIKKLSDQEFAKGVAVFKNKKDFHKAIVHFKASILIFPQAKSYYELGNALLELNKEPFYEEALKAYEVAEYLDFQPIFKVYYKSAVAYYILSNSSNTRIEEKDGFYFQSLSMLRNAFQSGLSDTNLILTDNRMRSITSTPNYKSLLTTIEADNLKTDKALFSLFIKSFPQKPLPFEISPKEVAMKEYKEAIIYDFAEYIPEMEMSAFGDEVTKEYFYVTKIADKPTYKAVIYTATQYSEEKLDIVTTDLVTYDKNGKIISKKTFACQCSPSKIKTGKIQDGVITIEEYKRTWEKSFDEVAFKDNKVKDHIPVTKIQYKINSAGKIIIHSPVNYSDTLRLANKN